MTVYAVIVSASSFAFTDSRFLHTMRYSGISCIVPTKIVKSWQVNNVNVISGQILAVLSSFRWCKSGYCKTDLVTCFDDMRFSGCSLWTRHLCDVVCCSQEVRPGPRWLYRQPPLVTIPIASTFMVFWRCWLFQRTANDRLRATKRALYVATVEVWCAGDRETSEAFTAASLSRQFAWHWQRLWRRWRTTPNRKFKTVSSRLFCQAIDVRSQSSRKWFAQSPLIIWRTSETVRASVLTSVDFIKDGVLV